MGRLVDREQAIEWLRDVFAADITKVLLSGLILLSLVLEPERWGTIFFGVFFLELLLRAPVLLQDYRRHQLSTVEVVFFGLDFIATVSFLPFHKIWPEARLLRLLRLSRMLLLLHYWGPIVREVWVILTKRERRYQLAFVVITVVILTFTSALLLQHFHAKGIDFNGDGNPNNDHFTAMLWWCFLQLESADNILKDPNVTLGFFFSVFLTLSGLFLFSFFIGIGNSVVVELVAISRQRRLGARRHSVICNIGPHNAMLLHELITYYAKSLRPPRIVTMGAAERRYDYMLDGPLQRLRYRQGQALSRHDLLKVDMDRATRVILLGQTNDPGSDSEVVSQVLSVREVNKTCPIYAELFRPDNISAVLHAGGEHTVPVMANRLVSLYLANLIVFPGIEEIYRDLLTSLGDEIYTCIYDQGAMAGQQPPSGALLPFDELLDRCHRTHGVILLGHLLDDPAEPGGVAQVLLPGAALGDSTRPAVPEVARLRGLFGVASNFERLRTCVKSFPDVSAPLPPLSLDGLPSFGVCPGASRISRFFIGGFHDGLPDFCEELILFTGVSEICLMVPSEAEVDRVTAAFVGRAVEPTGSQSGEGRSGATQGGRLRFSAAAAAELRYESVADGRALGTLRLLSGDWSDDRTLSSRLADVDAMLLTYLPGEADPDARTALAALKLIQLGEQAPGLLKTSFRLFCEFQNTEKAALFQRRFAAASAGSLACGQVGVVAAEWARNAFLAQAVFVPGIVSIYRELLSQAGVYLCKLLPGVIADPEATLSFGQLLTGLYRRDGFLAVGLELEENGARRVVVNPQPRSRDYTFKAGQIVSLFAVGDFTGFRRSAPCRGCFVEGPLSENESAGGTPPESGATPAG
jgi:hypothetical protein